MVSFPYIQGTLCLTDDLNRIANKDLSVLTSAIIKPPGVPKDALYNFDPESNGYNLVDGSAFHIWDYVEQHAGLSIQIAHAMKTWGPTKVSNIQLQ